MGTPTQKKFTHFFVVGMMEMQWLQNTQSLNLNKMKSRKNTEIVYTCKQLESFLSNLIFKDALSYLHFGMESPPAERV